jgi:hypothetical protein
MLTKLGTLGGQSGGDLVTRQSGSLKKPLAIFFVNLINFFRFFPIIPFNFIFLNFIFIIIIFLSNSFYSVLIYYESEINFFSFDFSFSEFKQFFPKKYENHTNILRILYHIHFPTDLSLHSLLDCFHETECTSLTSTISYILKEL